MDVDPWQLVSDHGIEKHPVVAVQDGEILEEEKWEGDQDVEEEDRRVGGEEAVETEVCRWRHDARYGSGG
jgi:hypothetical protein